MGRKEFTYVNYKLLKVTTLVNFRISSLWGWLLSGASSYRRGDRYFGEIKTFYEVVTTDCSFFLTILFLDEAQFDISQH